jgi:hypothetical protein
MLEATTRTAHISYDGKMLVTELYDDLVIEIEDAETNFYVVMDMVKGKKFVSLVLVAPNSSITKEAREDANKPDRYKLCIAQAIVVSSLATRILGNFMIRFLKTHCPQRLFKNREEATAWLNHHWQLHQQMVEME